MKKMNDINEAVLYLKSGEILTCSGSDQFVYKNDRVYRYTDGTRYSLDLNEFVELYKKNSFYLYEETVEIDETKDEAYYRYYRK